MPQGKISDIIRGATEVKHLDKFEEIADGLNMPDAVRIALGLAPQAPSPQITGWHGLIVSGETKTAMQSSFDTSLLNLDSEDEQEDNDEVRRRTFVGLTGTAMLNAMFGDTAPDAPPPQAEPFAPILAGHTASITGDPSGQVPDIKALTVAVDNARRQYQECHYSELINYLPALLTRLHAACLALTGQDASTALRQAPQRQPARPEPTDRRIRPAPQTSAIAPVHHALHPSRSRQARKIGIHRNTPPDTEGIETRRGTG
jgi:hypothetical protein